MDYRFSYELIFKDRRDENDDGEAIPSAQHWLDLQLQLTAAFQEAIRTIPAVRPVESTAQLAPVQDQQKP